MRINHEILLLRQPNFKKLNDVMNKISEGRNGMNKKIPKYAYTNIEQLIKDSGQEGVTYFLNRSGSRGEFAFFLQHKDYNFDISVSMPNYSLNELKYGNGVTSPRLNIGGCLLMWKYALDSINFAKLHERQQKVINESLKIDSEGVSSFSSAIKKLADEGLSRSDIFNRILQVNNYQLK